MGRSRRLGPGGRDRDDVRSRVLVSVEVRDDTFAAARDAQARVRAGRALRRRARRVRLLAARLTRAAQGEFDAGESGVYQLVADARRAGVSLGTATTWALVGGADREFVNPRRDEGVLRRVVDATGGQVLDLADLARLPGLLREAIRRPEAMVERDLWHTPWVFLRSSRCSGSSGRAAGGGGCDEPAARCSFALPRVGRRGRSCWRASWRARRPRRSATCWSWPVRPGVPTMRSIRRTG